MNCYRKEESIIQPEAKQLIVHNIELSDETNPTIGQFELHIMLHVPKSHIATDIRTGFPNLIREDRIFIDKIILNAFSHFQYEKAHRTDMRPLQFIDQFLAFVEPLLIHAFELQEAMAFQSLSVSLFVDTMQQEYSYKSDY